MRAFSTKRRHAVSFVEQGEHSECGLACAAMMLGAFGLSVTLEELRARYGSPRGGLSVAQLVKVITECGLVVRGVKAENVDTMAEAAMPCILYWDDNHFVVLEYCSRKRFHIVDPADGRHTYDIQYMREHSTGVLIVPERESAHGSYRRRRDDRISRLLCCFIGQHPGLIASAVFVAFASQGLTLVVPIVTRLLIDRQSIANTSGFLAIVAVTLLMSLLAYYLVNVINTLIVTKLQVMFGRYLFDEYMTGVMLQDFSFFVNRSSGDLIYRANLVLAVEQVLAGGLITTVTSFIFTLIYLIMMFSYSAALTVLTLFICTMILLVSLVYARYSKRITDYASVAQAEVQRSFIEIFSGIETIKSLHLEQYYHRQWFDRLDRQLSYQVVHGRLSAALSSLSAALVFVLPLTIVMFGICFVGRGIIGLGTVVSFMALSASFAAPFSGIITIIGQFAALGTYLRKIIEILPLKIDDEKSGSLTASPVLSEGKTPTSETYGLTAIQAGYAYEQFSAPVVQDIRLNICKGDKIAIVGPTGSGKSTLLKMLAGLIRPTQGTVEVEPGVAVSEINDDWAMRHMAFVHQDTTVFNETLKDNILLHRDWIDESQLRQACLIAGIDDRMMDSAAGLGTMISEHGMNLSGGQCQKIAIARALVAEPEFLLLDEPTSSLDNETEQRIMHALLESPAACVVVAHRLSSIQDFDRIYVMDHGTFVETGAHDELVGGNGLYARLYRQSAQEPRDLPVMPRDDAGRV